MLWLFSNKKRIYINYKANKSVCQLERLREISQQYSDHIACASEMASSRLCSLQSNPCLYLFWTKALHASQPSVVGAHLCWLWNSVTWLLWLHVAGKLPTAWEERAKSHDRTRKIALSLQLVAVCCSLGVKQEHWPGPQGGCGQVSKVPHSIQVAQITPQTRM